MFNSGIRGRRARDGEGSLAVNDLYVQKISPVASVSRIAILDGSGNTIDDTALDTAGGQTILVVGGGFELGVTVTVGGTSVSPVTRLDSTRITFTSPAKSSGSHALVVNNTNGSSAIFVPGLVYSGTPTFVTSAGSLGNVYETTAINTTISATSDSAISYSVVSGNLPPGSSLSSAGVLSGTAPAEVASTTYTFTVKATDGELQDSTREFSITINADVVTWQYPQDQQTVLIENTSPTITLDAVSAAGYSVGYTASALPTGLTLTNGVITGTVSEETDTAATLTATANTTGRSSAISITWRVSLADSFFKLTSLLINADRDTWITDTSTNGFEITPAGDAKPSAFSPYNTNWSNYFDGSGDYLTAAASETFDLGGGSFTVEGWFYVLSTTANPHLFQFSTGTNNRWNVYRNVNFYIFSSIGADINSNTGTPVPLNKWFHLAVVKNSTTTKIYLNGAEIYSDTRNYPTGNMLLSIGFQDRNGVASDYLTGWSSNFRVIKGTAVYTTNFTPPTTPLTAIAGTSLLTCQSNRLRDASINNFTITRNGDTKVTSFGPFTETDTVTGSGYFDGTGDVLSLTSNASLNFGTGDFTIECWVNQISLTNPPAAGSQQIIVMSESSNRSTFYILTDGRLQFTKVGVVDANLNGSSSTRVRINSWNHIAFTRSGTTMYGFINGELVGSSTRTESIGSSTGTIQLFLDSAVNNGFYGYATGLRVLKGTALYTSTFTPPTAPLTPVANTSLLTLQNRTAHNNNTFLDDSGNKFNITRNGNATQGSFSPFSPSGWSAYFDGTGDELVVSQNLQNFFTATGDWTAEAWVYPTSFSGPQYSCPIFGSSADAFVVRAMPTAASSTSLNLYIINNASAVVGGNSGGTSGGSISINQWSHVAAVRRSGVFYVYLNGIQVISINSPSDQMRLTDTNIRIGGASAGTNPYWTGYISNVRVVRNSAVYTSNFTLSTAPLQPITNTVLLTCRTHRFDDEGPNRFTITRVGDTRITPFSPFGPHTVTPDTYSVYFDGNGDSLSVPGTTEFQFGTGDFTVEAFVYLNSVSTGDAQYFAATYDGANGGWAFYSPSGSTSLAFRNGDAGIVTRSYTFSSATWYHLAVLRSSSTLKFFVDGTQIGSDENSYTQNITRNNSNGLSIGRYGTSINQFGAYVNGYVSNLRVIKGTAVTPPSGGPTSPVTAVSGTQLLTCQSLTITDNSPNAFSITVNGNSQPTKFNPFGETVATNVQYSPTVHGGSGYFDGSGDLLQIADNGALEPTNRDWCIELWMYPTVTSDFYWLGKGDASTAAGSTFSCIRSSFAFYIGGSSYTFTTNSKIITNQWNHIVWCRKGTDAAVFINGERQSSTTGLTTSSLNNVSQALTIGGYTGTPTTGYISNFVYTIGNSLYNPTQSILVVPATMSEATSNTAALLNFTAAGSTDSSSRNVLETVGDVKVISESPYSVNQSVYFDGSGDYIIFGGPLSMGTSDWTMEMWIYPTDNATRNFFQYGNFIMTSGSNQVTSSVAGPAGPTGTNVFPNTWTHIAAVRSGGNVKIYVNGVSGSAVAMGNDTATGAFIGTSNGAPSVFLGYISNIRVVRGTAVYTSNFTPPTAPLTAVTNTNLLTCQSNRFVDNSTNNYTFSITGDVKITSRGPFTETVPPRSLKFDGAGDYLIAPSTLETDIGGANFTVECWVYITNLSGNTYHSVFGKRNASPGLTLGIRSNGSLFAWNGTTEATSSGITIQNNTWYYIAWTVSGSTLRMFINGTIYYSNSYTFSSNTNRFTIGASLGLSGPAPADYLYGYIDDLRITKGVARYTANFTPPAAPFKTR